MGEKINQVRTFHFSSARVVEYYTEFTQPSFFHHNFVSNVNFFLECRVSCTSFIYFINIIFSISSRGNSQLGSHYQFTSLDMRHSYSCRWFYYILLLVICICISRIAPHCGASLLLQLHRC